MIESPDAFNPLDIAVLAVLIVSAGLAFARGFTREVLSVAAWLGASAIAWFAFPHVRPIAQHYIQTKIFADVAASGGVFLLALILLVPISHKLSANVRQSSLSAVDRSLGFAFGVARGSVVLCLAYLFMLWLWPGQGDQPEWFRTAKAGPLLNRGATLLREMVPNPTQDPASREAELMRIREQQARERDEALERLSNPLPNKGKIVTPPPDRGYSGQERGRMEQLIKNSGAETPAPPPPN